MPYVTHDLYGGTVQPFLEKSKFKRIFLCHWPRKVITYDGIDYEVFDRLYTYNGSVIHDTTRDKLYKLLGISYDDLQSQDYSGVESTWLEMKPYELEDVPKVLTDIQVQSTIEDNVVTEGYIDIKFYTELFTRSGLGSNYDPYVYNYYSNATLLNNFKTALDDVDALNIQYDFGLDDYGIFQLLDRDSEYYELTYELLSKENDTSNPYTGGTLLDKNPIGYGNINIRVRYKLKETIAISPSAGFLYRINHIIAGSKYITLETIGRGRGLRRVTKVAKTAMYMQFIKWFNIYNPYSESALFLEYEVDDGFGGTVQHSYIKAEGTELLKVNDFSIMVSRALSSDYEEESRDLFEEFLVILFIAAVTIVSAGLATGGAITLGSLALASSITIGVFALGAMILAKNGHASWAATIGNAISAVSVVSYVLGAAALFQSLANSAATQIVKESAKQGVTKTMEQALSEVTVTHLLKAIVGNSNMFLSNLIKGITTAFNYYREYKEEEMAEEISDLQKQLEASQDMMDAMPTAKQYDTVTWYFETYQEAEPLDNKIDRMVYSMVQGKVDNATNKYF